MRDNSHDLQELRFRKDFSYDRTTPTFISSNIGGPDEIARWVLDLNDVQYHDDRHAPYLADQAIEKITALEGPGNSPALVNTDTLLYSADSIIQYYLKKNTCPRPLLPDDPARRDQTLELYALFTGYFNKNVTAYIFSLLLPDQKSAVKWMAQGLSSGEKARVKMNFLSIKSHLYSAMNLEEHPAGERLIHIKKVFQRVDELLADGRHYLTGETMTIADIAFASVAALVLLPEEYGGAIANIQDLPDEMRTEVYELRTRPAGQFALLLYQEDRPSGCNQEKIPKDPGALKKLAENIAHSLGNKKTGLFYFLQKNFPVLKIPFTPFAAVNRNDLLVEMMERDNDFTVEEINAEKMARQKGAFFLGFDRRNPQFDRERNFVRATARREDMDLIRAFIRNEADEIINYAKPFGKLDVANTLCYPILVKFIDQYFGVPAPSETIMKHWLRVLFYDLFLNFTNNKKKHQMAVDAALARRTWILQLIKDRKQELKDGKTLADNITNRMILLQAKEGNAWFDDETLHRNIGGLITGILETTNKAVILVLDELFRRPEALKGAIETAHKQDMTLMYGYVKEAMRFNPAQPGVIRYCEQQQTLTGKGTKKYKIAAKKKVFALTACAMMDPKAFPEPKKFDPTRDAVYMNYGYALHECYGKYINAVTISELVAAVLRLPNVRRMDNRAGKGTGLHEGPFFNNFVVAFD